jgi:large-conductance mechanosensitive channel
MQQAAVGSFLKFLTGFVTFIIVAFAVTYVVSIYSVTQTGEEQAAAAKALMLQQK